MGTGRRIGAAKEQNGLYYVDHDVAKENQLNLVCSSQNKPNTDEIWLHHFRLGHPPFRLLKTMFPSLFSGLDGSVFHCEVCEISKHHCVSFPVSNKFSSIPFSLVHSNVWGPSQVPNCSGAKWFVSFIDDCTRTT